jgi:hypothetical protein
MKNDGTVNKEKWYGKIVKVRGKKKQPKGPKRLIMGETRS